MNAALAGLVILVLGDSHMAGRDYLLTHLHDQLEAAGASVHSYGMCGASAGDWIYKTTVSCGRGEHHDKSPPVTDRNRIVPTWSLNDLIRQNRPNLVVIELADAMAGYGSPEMPKAWIYDQVRALTGRLKADNIPCVWVGPIWGNEGPPYRKTISRVTELSQFLAQTVAPCAYIDSTQFARPGQWATTDGQHLNEAGYRAWGEGITNALERLRSQHALR